MWIKFALCALIVAFSVAVGAFASGKYRARKKLYAQFCAFNELYLTELKYMRRPIGEFFAAYAYEGDFKEIVAAAMRREPTTVKTEYLTQEERGCLDDYFSMLGRGDAQSQNAYFSAQKEYLAAKKGESEREAKERAELYLKLGLLAGLALVILIV